MLIFEHKSARNSTRILNEMPMSITRESIGAFGVQIFPSGKSIASTCLSCVAEPCKEISKSELALLEIANFAIDSNKSVCPVDALGWDNLQEVPSVDTEVCIGCGLCAARCPVGAIGVRNGVAEISVNTHGNDCDATTSVQIGPDGDVHSKQIVDLPNLVWSASIRPDDEVSSVTEVIFGLPERQQEIAVRSALAVCGIQAVLSRKGDVHTRADGFFQASTSVAGPLEIEFGVDSLEAVRSVLDDIAVFHSRFGLDVKEQEPLVVCGQLPRSRQGYWQVVSDIVSTLDINVHTVSMGALLLIGWNGGKLSGDNVRSLNPSFDATSIRSVVESILGRTIDLKLGEAGILEPEK